MDGRKILAIMGGVLVVVGVLGFLNALAGYYTNNFAAWIMGIIH